MTIIYLAADDALAILTTEHEPLARCELQLQGRATRCLAVDPLRPELVYCGAFGDGVWRSDDAGRSWRPSGEGLTHSKVLSVAVSPSQRRGGRGVVYAGTEPSAVFRSEDGGGVWQMCPALGDLPSAKEWSFPPRPHTHHVRWIHADPHTDRRLLVAIEAGALIRSTDGGATWQDRTADAPIDTHQLATHESAPGRYYSAAGDGYFESSDGGESWRQVEDGLLHNYVWSVAVDPADPETRIIAAAASPRHSHDKDRAESFIYRRTGSSSWQVVREGLPDPAGRRTAVLAAHSSKPGAFFAAWDDDIYWSTNGGSSWQPLNVAWPGNWRVNEPHALIVTDA